MTLLDGIRILFMAEEAKGHTISHLELHKEDLESIAAECRMVLVEGEVVELFGIPIHVTTGNRRLVSMRGPSTFRMSAGVTSH